MIGLTNPETGAIFYSDNDDWWPDTGTDKNYTNGFRLTITRNSDPLNLRRFRIFRWIPDRPGCHVAMSDQTCVNTAFHFGQQFYTPDDITISELIPRSPYAGWLYVGGSWQAANEDKAVNTDVFLGFTGGPSLAREVQTGWHRIVDAKKPMGWGHQIGDRFGVVIAHTRHMTVAEAISMNGHRWFELTPFYGGTVGNILTDGYVGARAKIGYNLTRDWTHTSIGPVAARPGRARPGIFEVFLSVDGRGRLVAYNVFVDAANQHDLGDRRIAASDAAVGFGVRVADFMFTYRIATTSREYDAAPSRHEYKSLRFMYVIR